MKARITIAFLCAAMLLQGCGEKHREQDGDKAPAAFAFQTGDLVFQDLDCGELCEAIEKVTPAYKSNALSHVGILEVTDTQVVVIEAIGENVHKTPIQRFLDRSRDSTGRARVFVGRLLPDHRYLLDKAIRFCNEQVGKTYDEAFLPGNDKYYCSELLYDAFRFANDGRVFFPLAPMTFRDPATGEFFPAWLAYYDALGMSVPEGVPGCNPGGIANDPKVEVIEAFY